jgi:hypothetical protein
MSIDSISAIESKDLETFIRQDHLTEEIRHRSFSWKARVEKSRPNQANRAAPQGLLRRQAPHLFDFHGETIRGPEAVFVPAFLLSEGIAAQSDDLGF